MSIIYDALQKTQQKIKDSREIITQKKSSRDLRWFDILLLVMIVSLFFLVICAYLPKFKNSSNKSPVPNAQASISTAHEMIPLSATPTPNPIETAYKGKLVLKGVFISDQEKFALINNQSVHLGDIVEGMSVVSIEFDKVKLLNGSQLFVLRTSS